MPWADQYPPRGNTAPGRCAVPAAVAAEPALSVVSVASKIQKNYKAGLKNNYKKQLQQKAVEFFFSFALCIQSLRPFPQLPTWQTVMVSTGMELTFLLAAGTVLGFGCGTRILLTAH